MTALLMLLYGVAAYGFFLATFVYAIGFVGGMPFLPTTIDGPASFAWTDAVPVNLALLGLFAVQHSVMARPAFKRAWTRIVPEPVERSTFVLAATAALALLCWQWRPIATPVIWQVTSPTATFVLYALAATGWVVLLISTFLINHFELFGLRQVWTNVMGRTMPAADFRTPGFYRHVRHPIYVGFLIGFWATPTMTAGHLLFALASTGYILIGIWFEERDLVAQFGERYRAYRTQVGMLIPTFRHANGGRPAQH